MVRYLISGLLFLTAALGFPVASWANLIVYEAKLNPVNDSGASGFARFTLDGNLLNVDVQANGLKPNQFHTMSFGSPSFSGGGGSGSGTGEFTPSEPLNINNGFGQTSFAMGGSFLTGANGGGSFNANFNIDDHALPLRTLETHGLSISCVENGVGSPDPGAPNPDRPVASGSVSVAPEPSSMALLMLGTCSVLGYRYRRRQKQARDN